MEKVGSLGSKADDVLLLGECDDGVRRLADACGWLTELEELWAGTTTKATLDRLDEMERKHEKSPIIDETTLITEATEKPGALSRYARDAALQAEVDKLVREVGDTLRISDEHHKATLLVSAKPEPNVEETSRAHGLELKGSADEDKTVHGFDIPAEENSQTEMSAESDVNGPVESRPSAQIHGPI